jgi:hypothetical protein
MAAAGMWLGDERGSALARACHERGLVVRRAALCEISGDSVTIDFGDRLLRLRGRPVVAGAVPPPLIVQVDGVTVARVRFARDGHPEAAEVVRRLQQGGLSVFLASERVWAKQLGLYQYCGNMSTGDKIQFLRSLRRQSVGAAYIGDCLANAAVAHEAHLSIGFAATDTAADAGWDQGTSDVDLLAPSISPLPTLCALARDSVRRRKHARYAVVIPNLLSVAGALTFGLTPTAVVLISNFSTSMAYNGAKRSLRKAQYASTALGTRMTSGRTSRVRRSWQAHEEASLDKDTVSALPQDGSTVGELTAVRVERLPKDAGWLLITAGVVGLVVPGVIGTPLLLAGALVLAPGGTKLLSRWVGHSGMRQIGRFLDNLERRYPRRRRGNAL